MKIAEALIKRNELLTKINQTKQALLANMQVQEGEQPSEDPTVLLTEYTSASAALLELMQRIHRSNATATTESGQTINEAMLEREALDRKISLISDMLEHLAIRPTFSNSSEIRWQATLPAANLRAELTELSAERSALDMAIQRANWTHDLQP